MPFYDVTLSLDTSAYAANDLLADTQLVNAKIFTNPKQVILDSVRVQDDDDQGIALDLVLLKANTSLGSENSAPSINDANVLAAIIGTVVIAAADFVDIGGARIAEKRNIGMPLNGDAAVGLYIGSITRGTPTHTAAGLKVRLGVTYR